MGQGTPHISAEERRDRLRLIRSQNVGPATFAALLRHFGTAQAALEAAPELSRRGGRGREIRIATREAAEAEMAGLDRIGGRLIALGEPGYPPPLAAIDDPPPLIQVLGDPGLLDHDCLAVVGARNASAAGRRFARDMATELGRRGLAVVSGMARGIDAAAHEGALPTGTIAVVAGGVDIAYPAENARLYGALVESGAVISEQPLGTEPTARHFPPRNRLISGLSLGILVVEAAPRSGSLITARMALEQGREVFAVPGSPMDPRHRGTNGLIRDGAVLTETADDITGHLEGMRARAAPHPVEPAGADHPLEIASGSDTSPAHEAILALLGPVPVTVDELLRECQVSPAVMNTVLLELELAGRLERHPGSRVSLLS